MKRILLTKIFFLSFTVVFAANRFWVGTLPNNNWNNAANWSLTSGGAGGASVPGAADAAIFNAGGNVDCNIDVAVTIQSLQIQNTYIHTISQNGNNVTITGAIGMTMAAGIWVGGSGNLS